MPEFQWFTSTATGIGVGVLLLTGFGTSLAASGLVAVMVAAFWTVHRSAGFWVTARPEDGWVGLALVAGGAALAAVQIAAFLQPRISAEA